MNYFPILSYLLSFPFSFVRAQDGKACIARLKLMGEEVPCCMCHVPKEATAAWLSDKYRVDRLEEFTHIFVCKETKKTK